MIVNYFPSNHRSSGRGYRSNNVSIVAYNFEKTKVGQMLQSCYKKFAVSPYFMKMQLGTYFNKCTA